MTLPLQIPDRLDEEGDEPLYIDDDQPLELK